MNFSSLLINKEFWGGFNNFAGNAFRNIEALYSRGLDTVDSSVSVGTGTTVTVETTKSISGAFSNIAKFGLASITAIFLVRGISTVKFSKRKKRRKNKRRKY